MARRAGRACLVWLAAYSLSANPPPAEKTALARPASPMAWIAPLRDADTNAAPAVPSIAPALRQSTRFIVSSNLVGTAHDQELEADPAREFQLLLEVGRKQRVQKDTALARRNFIALLEGAAPDGFKRAALLELATMAQEDNEMAKAQQLYAQYLRRWPDDINVPEVYLRQGLLFRQMGAPVLALSKFYAVLTSALSLKSGNMEYYQKLVLHAQAEIADTYYLQGRHADAVDFFRRLLKLDARELNKQPVQAKLVRSLAALGEHAFTLMEAQDYLTRYPQAEDQAEVRFLFASALKQSGRKADALKHVLLLLEDQKATARERRGQWVYWQRRAGNEIGNQLYEEGDYLNALLVYSSLATLDTNAIWQVPVFYQVGLIYERLQQPQKAAETYGRIVAREKELDAGLNPGLRTVLDMARWRRDFLNWQTQTDRPGQTNAQAAGIAPPLAQP